MAGDDGNVKPTAIWAKTVTRELRATMQGRVVSRGDDDYPRTRQIFNGAVENQPALIAVCETSADVQAAVRSARQHGLPLSVRGGGHDLAGYGKSRSIG
jgi:FAD/FMN-containing dehydrogenase